MIVSTHDRNEDQDRRLRLKTQDARLARMAVEGAGLSPWESDVLVEMIQEVYFSNPSDRPLGGGRLRYECVAAGEGAGKPIADCRLQTVVLSLLHTDDHSVPGRSSSAPALVNRSADRVAASSRWPIRVVFMILSFLRRCMLSFVTVAKYSTIAGTRQSLDLPKSALFDIELVPVWLHFLT